MTQLTFISERINALWKLSRRDVVFLDDLLQEFRLDLQTFITGETLHMKDGKVVVGNNLYRKWLKKLMAHGFDYEIHFK